MKKSELLNWLQEEYQKWEAFLDQIGPARMDQPGVNGDWSMKDIAAHLTGWQRRVVASLQAAQRGEPEPPPPWPAHLQSEDEINAWIYESNRGRSVREVLDETHQVFQQLLAVIEGFPDDVRVEHIEPAFYLVWLDGKRFPAGEFFDHFHDDHEPDIRAWLERAEKHQVRTNTSEVQRRLKMNIDYKTIIWQQFGAAIDMLGDALEACPDELLSERLWDNSPERAEYSEVWFVVSHTLYWLDLYLSGGAEDFAPPARFSRDGLDPDDPLPETPFTKDELQTYLDYCRRKCQTTIEALTDETAQQRCRFGWGEVSFAELLLYNMRHVQEHAAQLNLMLGHKVGSAPDWVPQARSEAA